jgi:Fe-S-cluster containining protein
MSDGAQLANICIGCGLCCDSTLFSRVRLKPDDDPSALDAHGFTTREHDGKVVFDQPCPHFGDGSCAVYAVRPSACRSYRCDLRKRFDTGEVAAVQATAIVQKVRAFDWQASVRPSLEQLTRIKCQSLSHLLIAANTTIAEAENPAALRRQYGTALLRGVHMLALLRQYFLTDSLSVEAENGR